ncbi:MAG: NAD(P)-binding domain-containing protein [Oscillospiraceae bacterium]|nr:NAD(P)-binding domain-containing protein [Oscillospiraceae bacterium]
MKVALHLNRDNFDRYSDWDNTGWDFAHLGLVAPDPATVIATKADVIVAASSLRIGADIIRNMPELKLVQAHGVGFNLIDVDAAREAGVYVCNCAGANARSVAEHAVMMMLALLKRYRYNEDMVYAGKQMDAKIYCFENGLPDIYGRKVGIVGYGAIGKELASILKAFGCKLCYYDTIVQDSGDADVAFMPLEELYTTCDIVTLHVPVTPETTSMVNAETLKLFKRGAILINSARGELMDQQAVAAALISGQLGALGADTLSPEPYTAENPLIGSLPEEVRYRVALSPHIAGVTESFFSRAYERGRGNIEAIMKNERPACIVNGL